MNSKYKYIYIFLLIPLAGFLNGDTDLYFKIYKGIDVFGSVYKVVATNYVDPIDPEKFINSGIEGMLASLDPYTVYFDKEHKADVDFLSSGFYGGIGASIGLRNDNAVIIELFDGYSADRQGIRVGDKIVKINGKEITKENYNEAIDEVKGEPGTELKLVIERDGVSEPLEFTLQREQIEVKNITFYGFVPQDKNTAYIRLSGFNRTAGYEIETALIDMKKQKEIKGLILDLRGNPGGLLDAAIDVTEKFIQKNELVVTIMGRDSSGKKSYLAQEEPLFGKNNLVVLVDRNSASASEIVAGAIQDHDRGIILGETSFGKGLVQTVIPLSNNNSVKVTTGRYYTPSGRCIQRLDYSNKLLKGVSVADKNEYFTKNKRKVQGGGGIKPDTSVTIRSKNESIDNLLAGGMFFKFATNFFNTNDSVAIMRIKDEELIRKFNDYLLKQNFKFTSKFSSALAKLQEEATSSSLPVAVEAKLKELAAETEKSKLDEISKYRDEIIPQIRIELERRFKGRKGRILEAVKYDKQFQTALTLINDNNAYNKILNYGH